VLQHGQETVDGACHSYTKAKQIAFSAVEYMPMALRDSDLLRGEFDWDSIMLYGSTIGASGDSNVYTRASDGAVIGNNKAPSPVDIARFQELYSEKAPRPNPCLLKDDCNPAKAMFYKTIQACKNIGKS
jgi:hypothetical protein